MKIKCSCGVNKRGSYHHQPECAIEKHYRSKTRRANTRRLNRVKLSAALDALEKAERNILNVRVCMDSGAEIAVREALARAKKEIEEKYRGDWNGGRYAKTGKSVC
jgi:hypothetical protein